MILEVRSAVRALLPDLFPEGHALSIAKVQTTRSSYMAFSEDQPFPVCVVQFGSEEDLRALDGVLRSLHEAIPSLVPRPLACEQWSGDSWVRMQSGLPGFPWFSLRHRVRTLEGWVELRDRALATLHQFHAGVRTKPSWRRKISFGDELWRQLEVSRDQGHPLSKVVLERAGQCAKRLEALGSGVYPWQHGDYSFNNLLVSPDRLGVIDFEEFGSTVVPLQDQLSLAFSVHEFMQGVPGAPAVGAQIRRCTLAPLPDGTPITAPLLEALLYYHLLWRLNQCLTRGRPLETSEVFLAHLERLASSSSSYVWESEQEPT